MRSRSTVLLTLVAVCLFPPALNAAEPLAGLDPFIEAAMKEWHVPGLAVAVVKNGKVALTKGYGYRDVDRKLPVTPRTLFAIGSISKSFTVSGLGMLADEKKLRWDRPVREYLPDFRLHERVGERVTLRDLVSHRTGLPRHDGLWFLTRLTRREMYDRLHHLEPSKDLRYSYQYNNLMFMSAGVLLERVSGRSWEDFVSKRLFEPLGMERSNFSITTSQKADDFALPYQEESGKVRRVPFRNIDAMGPAGSINSCALDMSHYLLFLLDQGKYGGKRLLSQDIAEEMQVPQMVIPLSVQKHDRFHEPGDSCYGLGLLVTRHRGLKMVAHGGAIDGFIAYLAFVPEKKIGVVVLSNVDNKVVNPVPKLVCHEVLDRLLGVSGIDWRERGRREYKEYADLIEKEKKKSAKDRKTGTTPSHPLSELAGTYEHPAFGSVKVQVEGKELKLIFSGGTFFARHYHYDTFEVHDAPGHPAGLLEDNKLMFQYGDDGSVDRFQIQLQEGVGDFTFRRVEPKKAG